MNDMHRWVSRSDFTWFCKNCEHFVYDVYNIPDVYLLISVNNMLLSCEENIVYKLLKE